ncbi:MAG: InlB B-repeat-containing protein [Oscillospiraceae bacterium]|nr:InlB B-repeat-containing protein [Oscillospiraceae bacterium]
MKKRILSVFLAFVMVTGVAVLPGSQFVLEAAADTGAVKDHGLISLNRWYDGADHGLGTGRIGNEYIINVPQDGEILVEINVARNTMGNPIGNVLPPGGANFSLREIDEHGTAVNHLITNELIDDNGDGSVSKRFAEDVTEGRYQLVITQESGDVGQDTGQYRLFVELFDDEIGGNDGIISAHPLEPGVTVRSTICSVSGADFYEYNFDEPGRLTIYIAGGNRGSAKFPIRGETVFCASHRHPATPAATQTACIDCILPTGNMNIQFLDEHDDALLVNASGAAITNFSVAYPHTPTGTFNNDSLIQTPYAAVIDVEAGPCFVRLSHPTTAAPKGTYSMRGEFIPRDDLNPERDENNKIENATELLLDNPVSVSGMLTSRNQRDLYKIEVDVPGVVLFDITRPAPATGSNSATASINPGEGGIGTNAPQFRILYDTGEVVEDDTKDNYGDAISRRMSGTGNRSAGLPLFNTAANRTFTTHVGFEPGIYYIEIERRGIVNTINAVNTGTYTLSLDFLPALNNEEVSICPPEFCTQCTPGRCYYCVCEGRVLRLECEYMLPSACIALAADPWDIWCHCPGSVPCEFTGNGECAFCVCKDMDTYTCRGIRQMQFGEESGQFGPKSTGLMSVIPNTHYGKFAPNSDGYIPNLSDATIHHRDIFEYTVTEPGIIQIEVASAEQGGLPNRAVDLIVWCYDENGEPYEFRYRPPGADRDVVNPLGYTTRLFASNGRFTTLFAYNFDTRTSISTTGVNANAYRNTYAVDPGIYRFELIQRNTESTNNNAIGDLTHRLTGDINNNNTGIYYFSAGFTPVAVDTTEPNNDRATASVLFDQGGKWSATGGLQPGERDSVTGMLTLADHTDYYRVVIDEPGRMQITVTRPSFGGLMNNRTEIVWWQENTSGPPTELRREALSIPYDKHLDLEITEPGIYFVEILKRPENAGSSSEPWWTYNSNMAGVYNLKLVFTATESDENFKNNVRAEATEIQAGQTIRGFMSHQETSDWYKYELEKDGNISITLERGGLFQIANNALDLRWYDEFGVQLGTGITTGNLPFNVTNNASLQDLPAGTYYVEVRRRSTATPITITGTYNIRVSDSNATPPTVSNVTIFPGITCCPLQKGHNMQFLAEVAGTNNPSQNVNWRIIETDRHPLTSINPSGLLTVHELETRTTLTIRATSAFNNNVQSEPFTVNIASVPSHLIALNVGANGRVTGGGWHAIDCNVTVTAIPNQDYAFDGWFEGGVKIADADASYTFPVTASRTLEARFRHAPGLRNITAVAGTGGSVIGGGSFEIGENVTLTASANPGFSFDGWYEGGSRVSTNAEYSFTITQVTQNRTLQARFVAALRQPVRVNNGTGGGNFAAGVTVNISANAAPDGMQFDKWTVPAELQGIIVFANASSMNTSFVMPNPAVAVNVTANYIPIPGTVTSVTVNPGTVQVQRGGDEFPFSVTVQGTNNPAQTVTWLIEGIEIIDEDETVVSLHPDTTIDENGVLVIDEDEMVEKIKVTATSTADVSISGTAMVTVTDEPPAMTVTSVTVTPNTMLLNRGGSFTFSAAAAGSNAPQGVTWSVTGTNVNGTTISTDGVLTIGSGDTRSSVTVTATSTHNTSISGSATVTIFQPTADKVLTSITAPNAVTGIANGTTAANIVIELQAQRGTVTLGTNDGNVTANVTWTAPPASAYNPATITQQTFVVNGNVTLPGDVVNTNNIPLTVSVNVTVNAATGQSLTITFSANNGSWSGTNSVTRTTNATTGRITTTLANPTRTGNNNVFDGWWTTASGSSGTKIASNSTQLSNFDFRTRTERTYYARWTTSGGNNNNNSSGDNEARTITFNLNGGTFNNSTSNFTRQTQDNGRLASNQIPTNPTRAGFTFDGWFTAASGGSERTLSSYTFTANTTLYAQWTTAGIQVIGQGTTVPSDFSIPAATVNSAASNLPFIRIRASAAGNQNIDLGTASAGQNAILVRRNTATGILEVVSGTAIGGNGQVTVNIPASGDYLVLARRTGDVTGTGTVETGDALALLRHVAGITRLDAIQVYVANGKAGDVNTNDALQILRLVAGVINRI